MNKKIYEVAEFLILLIGGFVGLAIIDFIRWVKK